MATDMLRPRVWNEFVGQDELKLRLNTHINSAKLRKVAMEHVFLAAHPGMGKTTLAELIAQELDLPFQAVTMPVPMRILIRIIRDFNGILLLDEIHRGNKAQQESLLDLVWEGYLRTDRGQLIDASSITLIGATTEPAKVIDPLRDRFLIQPHIDEYTDVEMTEIIKGMSERVEVDFTDEECLTLTGATAGIPRRARRFVLAARDLLVTTGEVPTPDDVLAFCRMDHDGLEPTHIAYLQLLQNMTGPVGLGTICDLLGESEATVRDIERLLMRLNMVERTDRGRELSTAGTKRARWAA